MICCSELFLAWFCSYDVDTVLDMNLIWFQLWFLMWVKIVIWSQPIGTISKSISKPYQNRIKSISKSYQNSIKTMSKSYQNRNKTFEELTKNLSLGCFCFFFWSQHAGTISKPYQNRIKTVSKSCQNRIKIVSKSCQNRINTISKHKTTKTFEKSARNLSLGCFCFFFWSQLTGTILKPYQSHPKPYLNHNPNHIKNIKPYRNHNPKFKAYQIHIFQSYQKPY